VDTNLISKKKEDLVNQEKKCNSSSWLNITSRFH